MREYGPGHPLVFSHIPKTAGTSLRYALRQTLEPEVFVGSVDNALFGGYFNADDLRGTIRGTLCLRIDELPADATLVAAHIAPSTTMARYPGADHITFLRAPQVRFMSQWLHTRTLSDYELRQWGRSAEMFTATRAPLREYLRNTMVAPNVDNTITRFLLGAPARAADGLHRRRARRGGVRRRARTRFVLRARGLVENAAFVDGLGAWLGRDLPSARLNERSSALLRRRPDLSAKLDPDTTELLRHGCGSTTGSGRTSSNAFFPTPTPPRYWLRRSTGPWSRTARCSPNPSRSVRSRRSRWRTSTGSAPG